MAAEPATTAPAPQFRESQRLLVVFRVVTEVDATGLSVRLSPVPGTGRHVGFEAVDSVEVASYRAVDHGGHHWGLRIGADGDAAYRAGGSRGVRVDLTDGSTLFVGSRRPGELRDAVAAGLGDG